MELWIPLAFLVAATAGSAAYAALRGWRLWRTFRHVSRRVNRTLERVADQAAGVERRALAAGGGTVRLAEALTRLEHSLAELAVLRAAYAEGRGVYSSIRGAVPRK